ncbi:MAG: rRNA pseudouridine synthase [Hyphomonadaceae bacterium]|nr:rRNA pseudouridine synthase [Hyphomonadaceae bacterium]
MARTFTYSGEEPVRINKWLAQSGICSRREAEGLINDGLVLVEGEKIASPGHKIEPGQTLSLAERASTALDNKLTILLNKPVGYVSGTPEGEQVPAVRLLTRKALQGESAVIPGRRHKLAPVGRLDQDSHGLLILSEDGVVAKAVIGPDSEMSKEYIVRIRGEITPDRLARLRHGLSLDGRRLKKAEVTQEAVQTLRFVLKEGRNRQIRRMCDLVELRVVDLKRIRIGPVELGDLAEGKWRPLTEVERTAMIAAGAPRRPKRDGPSPARAAPRQGAKPPAGKARRRGKPQGSRGPGPR